MWQRVLALAGKEFIQIRRDRRTLGMMIALPLIWLVMFGYAFSFDVQEVRVAVVDNSGTRIGGLVAGALRSYDRFRLVPLDAAGEAGIREAMYRDEVLMGIVIPPGYGERDGAQLQVLIDGSDLFGAQTAARLFQRALDPAQADIQQEMQARAQADVRQRIEQEMARRAADARVRAEAAIAERAAAMRGALQAHMEKQKAELLAQVEPAMRPAIEQRFAQLQPPALELDLPADLLQAPGAEGLNLEPPHPPQMAPQMEILYNPELRTANVMIPGLLGLVTMFMTTLMTALGIVREREHGTLEQLVVTPIRPLELMLGKLLPYALVAAVQFALVYMAGTVLFGVTFMGNLPVFLGLTLIFLITTLSLGLLLSTLAQNQQQAMQLAMFIIFPQILLSGLIFPLTSMPQVIQSFAQLLPFTHFVPIARGMFIKGQDLSLLMAPSMMLVGYAVVMVTLASLRFRKRLG